MQLPSPDDYPDWKTWASAMMAALAGGGFAQLLAEDPYTAPLLATVGVGAAAPEGFKPVWLSEADAELYLATDDNSPPGAPNLFTIDTTNITLGAITGNLIANATITSALIADAQIVTAKIADLAVNTAKMANLSVTSAKIANLAVGNAQIDNLAVTTAKIQDFSVVNAKIGFAAVQQAQIANLAVGAAQIQDLAVNSAKIQDLAVGTLKIGDYVVNPLKLASQAVTGFAAATFTTSHAIGNYWSDIPGSRIYIFPEAISGIQMVFFIAICTLGIGSAEYATFRMLREDNNPIGAVENHSFYHTAAGGSGTYVLFAIDPNPGVGGYNSYRLQARCQSSGVVNSLTNVAILFKR